MKASYNNQFKKIDDLGFIGRGRSRHRPRNDSSLYGGKYPFIQTGDVKRANFYLFDFEQTYNDKGLAQSKIWNKGTLCITIAANIAETAILGMKACFPDSIIGFIADETKSDVRFVKYCLDTYKIQIQSISQGATQDNLSLEKLRSINFVVPPLPIQKRIAGILSSYDELIENNNQRITLLEQMAEQIYKEWFVRFRFPGYENTKFVKGIPEGWEVKPLGKVIELEYGKSLPERERTDGIFPVYGSGGITGTHNKYLIKGPGIIVGRKGTVGSVYFVNEHFFPIDTVFFVRADLPLEYVYYNLLNQNFISGDAAVPGLKRDQAYANLFLVPGSEITNKFLKIISPFFDLKFNLLEQNKKLISSRDLLLPRLISGKLSVERAEAQTPEAATELTSAGQQMVMDFH